MSLSESALAGFYCYSEECLSLCSGVLPPHATEVHGDLKLAPPRHKVLALTFPSGFMTGKPRPRRSSSFAAVRSKPHGAAGEPKTGSRIQHRFSPPVQRAGEARKESPGPSPCPGAGAPMAVSSALSAPWCPSSPCRRGPRGRRGMAPGGATCEGIGITPKYRRPPPKKTVGGHVHEA
ncbi:hypothetical protein D1007_32335 [Hordeum vulgare]|nr:hypothetical protein D1007_32335 [Hordeum vulgare]